MLREGKIFGNSLSKSNDNYYDTSTFFIVTGRNKHAR